VVEAFREYLHENPIIQKHFQAGIDAIPEIVEEFHDED
jgi:hypothetical protein